MPDDIPALNRRIQQLEELHRLARSLNSVIGVYEMLELIANTCKTLCNAERVAIVLIDPTSENSADTLVRNPGIAGEIDHTVNGLMAGWVYSHQKALLTDDVLEILTISHPNHSVRQHGSAVAVPLMAEGKIIGVINLVNSRGKTTFAESNLQIANTIAPLAAQAINRAKMHQSLYEDNQQLKTVLTQHQCASPLLGEGPGMKRIREQISLVASSNATVLISGETGTGKELVARAIHCQSKRFEKPFIAVNCAAIPASLFESELFGHERGSFTGATEMKKGKFELAHLGTLFLDEISAMPLEAQPKILRMLEEHSVTRVGSTVEIKADIRIIAATNRDLVKAVAAGEFREDLYHRLNVIPIQLPPLRERIDDIPLLANVFMEEFSGGTKRFSPEALDMLTTITWKGNVRELRNIVERLFILIPSTEIGVPDLRSVGIGNEGGRVDELCAAFQSMLHSSDGTKDLLEMTEQQLVQLAMRNAHGNISGASRTLGIDRNALQRRIDKYRLQVNGP
jgi:transcriptional regulator with GAF, ATPase, and Fis domain